MNESVKPPTIPAAGKLGLVPKMLNHAAYVTHDTEATAAFYTQVMGMEIASTILDDKIPSTGDPFPYFHIFFRMGDGSTIAFFESPGMPPRAKSTHPAYDIFDHIALQVDTVDEIERWKKWLIENGLEVRGPINHKEMFLSIYFHDPNGYRLELTCPLVADWNQGTAQGYQDLRLWIEAKERARREGRDAKEVTLEVICELRKRYEH